MTHFEGQLFEFLVILVQHETRPRSRIKKKILLVELKF